MRDIIRPKRQKLSRHNKQTPPQETRQKKQRSPYNRPKSRPWFWKWVFRLVLILCFVSAAPMLALRYVNPPTSSFIELNKQSNNRNIKQQWLDMAQISLYFPNAVIASEDQQFPHHFGFDLKQIKLVIDQLKSSDNSKGFSRGASTITQQTVKNLFLWPGRSFLRKGLEAWLSLWMELIVPKKRILELYINFAQFGKSVFGIGAASQHYFGIKAINLTPEQSALIAASLPTPSRSNPAKPTKYLKERAAFIMDQMPRVGGRRMVQEL